MASNQTGSVSGDITQDIIRAVVMSVVTSGLALIAGFGVAISSEQVSLVVTFGNNVVIFAFLGLRIANTIKNWKPVQVQLVDPGASAPAGVPSSGAAQSSAGTNSQGEKGG